MDNILQHFCKNLNRVIHYFDIVLQISIKKKHKFLSNNYNLLKCVEKNLINIQIISF